MADKAVKMAEEGVRCIVVLGVDFMSENVRAVLDSAGHGDIPVYRVAEREIGCSLAESAETLAYAAWLEKARQSVNPLHVIYINTSLKVKAHAHRAVPTITCTSSNVMQTILQATAQDPSISIWYGPDTYMGHNLKVMLEQYSKLSDAEIARIHPQHNQASINRLLSQFSYFKQGNCVVHHMFGAEVVSRVREHYSDTFHTAHLEVPGEMFELAVEAQRQGRGVVGSTSNILNFILSEADRAAETDGPATIRVILGTEAGMITAIVRQVQAKLVALQRKNIAVEIIFPVSSEAVAQDDGLGIVPGVSGGEGCSTAGGCASCPYMKMNTLDALFDVAENSVYAEKISRYEPQKYQDLLDGRTIASVGGEPILFMRHFQRLGVLPDKLMLQVTQV
jgi:quinolinate synthase